MKFFLHGNLGPAWTVRYLKRQTRRWTIRKRHTGYENALKGCRLGEAVFNHSKKISERIV